jgi:hypothetical protein
MTAKACGETAMTRASCPPRRDAALFAEHDGEIGRVPVFISAEDDGR